MMLEYLYLFCIGIGLVKGLIEEFGLDGVQAYMHHIQENAELAVTTLLKDIGKRLGGKGQTKVSKQTVRSRYCLEMDRLALPLRYNKTRTYWSGAYQVHIEVWTVRSGYIVFERANEVVMNSFPHSALYYTNTNIATIELSLTFHLCKIKRN